MSNSFDQSHLDRKYFIGRDKYNCPYCNRKSITYSVIGKFSFNWSNERTVYGYRVRCGGDTCQRVSLHLSDHDIELFNGDFWTVQQDGEEPTSIQELEIDDLFFYHQPTTFFTLDSRVNEKVRKLVAESEGCSKMNYLIGASGCLRKAIYELLELEAVPRTDAAGASLDYGDRVKILKQRYPTVAPEYFDGLANIQGMTSEQLHEGGWKPWTQDEFRYLVEIVKEILTEIYVRPQEKASVVQKIQALRPQKQQSVNPPQSAN